MQAEVHFYLLNYDFSQEFADAHHAGEESANNRKIDWEDELAINDLETEHQVKNDSSYFLKGVKNGESFSEEIENMFLILFKTKSGEELMIGCSNEILDNYFIDETKNGLVIKIYLKSDEPLSNPLPGIYIAAKRFPENLIDA